MGAALFHKVAEIHALQAVAGRTDLLIDLEAALQLRLVELAANAGERPGLALNDRRLAGSLHVSYDTSPRLAAMLRTPRGMVTLSS